MIKRIGLGLIGLVIGLIASFWLFIMFPLYRMAMPYRIPADMEELVRYALAGAFFVGIVWVFIRPDPSKKRTVLPTIFDEAVQQIEHEERQKLEEKLRMLDFWPFQIMRNTPYHDGYFKRTSWDSFPGNEHNVNSYNIGKRDRERIEQQYYQEYERAVKKRIKKLQQQEIKRIKSVGKQ